MRRFSLLVLLAGLLWTGAIISITLHDTNAQNPSTDTPPETGLFIPVTNAPPITNAHPDPEHVSRLRYVRLSTTNLADSDRLTLNLFPERTFTAIRTSLAPHALFEDGYTWRGELEGQPLSNVTLTVGGGQLSLVVTRLNETYELRYLTEDVYAVTQRGPGAPVIDPDDGVRVEIEDLSDWTPPQPSAPVPLDDTPTQIDVLVVYSPSAEAARGGQTAILNEIQAAIDQGNQGFETSQVNVRFNLVHAAPTNYNLLTDASTVLTALLDGEDGIMDDVDALRDQYGADLVAIIHEVTNNICGRGNIPAAINPGYRNSAFASLTVPDCLTGLTLAHELGHNLGLEHNPEDTSATPETAITPYAFGYRDPGFFRTIMAYACTDDNLSSCPRIVQWSNQVVQENGRPVGNAAADNRTTMSETAPAIQYYRTCPTSNTQALNAGSSVDDLLVAVNTAMGDFCNAGEKIIQLEANATYSFTSAQATQDFLGALAIPNVEGNPIRIEGNNATIRLNDSMRFARIESGGQLTVRNLTIEGGSDDGSDNQNYDGGVFRNEGGTLTLDGVTIRDSNADDGGVIANYSDFGNPPTPGNLTVLNSTFANNQANDESNAFGGVISSQDSNLTVRNSTFSNNSARFAGAIHARNGSVILENSTFTGNSSTDDSFQAGGAVYLSADTVTTIRNSSFSGNEADAGAGVYVTNGATSITIEDSSFTDNRGERGLGIFLNESIDEASVTRSTFSGHVNGLWGGAIYADEPDLTVTNSTFSGNSVSSGGGALYSNSNLTLRFNTFVNNTANFGDVFRASSGTTTLFGNLLQGTDPCSGPVNSQGYNLTNANACDLNATGDQQGVTLYLGALANNGGPTLTHLPQANSPAQEAIPAAQCDLPTDQRGVTRPQLSRCEAGAVENEPGDLQAPTNLRQEGATGTSITLNWDDPNATEAEYRIERLDPDGNSYNEIASVNANVTTYTDTGLTCGAYSYRVRGFRSSDASFSPYAIPITARPTSLTITESDGATTVSEGGAGDTLTVSVACTLTENATVSFNTGAQLQSMADLTLTPSNSSQQVTVNAVEDAPQEGTHSAEIGFSVTGGGLDGLSLDPITVTILDTTPLTAPNNLSLNVFIQTHTFVWNDPNDDESGYRVERQQDGGAWSEVASVGADVTSFTDDDVACGVVAYRVRAYRAADDSFSPYSNALTSPIDVAPNLTITETAGDTRVVENGTGDSITIALDCRPSADVTLSFQSDAQLEAIADRVIAPADYQNALTIAINAQDDQDDEFDHTSTLSISASGGGYNGLGGNVNVHITDDDAIPFSRLDLDNNGIVTPADAVYVINRIGTDDLSADVNGDGTVDSSDVNLIIDSLGSTQP